MPKARARLEPTTSITTAPTIARMICVWTTGAWRWGVPAAPRPQRQQAREAAAIGRRTSACRSWCSWELMSGVSASLSVAVDDLLFASGSGSGVARARGRAEPGHEREREEQSTQPDHRSASPSAIFCRIRAT